MAPGRNPGRGPPSREVQVSKKLSWLLRHGAEKEGLQLGDGGYISLADVVSLLFAINSACLCFYEHFKSHFSA